MELKTLKLKIGNIVHQYYMELPPKYIQEGYNNFMYGPGSIMEAVDKWIEKEKERVKR